MIIEIAKPEEAKEISLMIEKSTRALFPKFYPDCSIEYVVSSLNEKDDLFLRAKRIEVPASMVGIPFYKKLGYKHKNNELIYEDGHFAMEKFNDGKN